MSPKTINITLDEQEHGKALKKKGGRTWKEVLMDGLEKEVRQE